MSSASVRSLTSGTATGATFTGRSEGRRPGTTLAAIMTERDADSIRRLLHAYGDAVLVRDEAAWGALWTDDGVWELGPDRMIEGRDDDRGPLARLDRQVPPRRAALPEQHGDDRRRRRVGTGLSRRAERCRWTATGGSSWGGTTTPTGARGRVAVLCSRSPRLYSGAPDLSGTVLRTPTIRRTSQSNVRANSYA